MNKSLSDLYNDRTFQSFLEEIFNYNGTFNVEYNVKIKTEYLKQTTFSFKSVGVIDYVQKVDSHFKLDDNNNIYIEGSRVLALLETVSSYESKTSNKLSKLVSSFKIQEAIPVILKTIREPRVLVINRLKQNRYLTVSKLFPYRYLHYLLSPFFDMSYDLFSKDYKIDVNIDIDRFRSLRNKEFEDGIVWLDDLSYSTISEITKYSRMIEKVLYEKELTTITSMYDIVVLYLNWVDIQSGIDKTESLDYIKGILSLRVNFPYGYVSTRRLLTALSDLYIHVDLETRFKPMRTIINRNFITNLLKYKFVTDDVVAATLIESLPSELTREALDLLNSSENVVKVVDKFKLKDPDIYQKLFKNLMKV